MHHPRTDHPEPADEGVSHSDISQAPEEIIAYWTPERDGRSETAGGPASGP
jgi:hypothetical protein